MRRRIRQLGLAGAVLVSAVAGWATPAAAHATLETTSPTPGAVLDQPPARVVLTFDQQVEVSLGSIKVFDAGSRRVDNGSASHPGGDSHSVQTQLPASLPSGGYVVAWRVISADSHPVHGAFTFTVGHASAAGLSGVASRALTASGGSFAVGTVLGAFRFLAFVAVAILLGGMLFVLAIWPDGRSDRRTRRLLWGAWAGLLIVTATCFAVQGAYGGGLPLADAFRPAVLSAVSHTRFGRAYTARLGLLVVGAPVMAVLLRRARAGWVALGAAIGVLILGTWGVAAHAGTGSLVPVALPFDVIHIGAAAVWVGGLVTIVAAVVPAGGSLRAVAPRFSQVALTAVVAIAGTGVFAAWQEARTWGALTSTTYGRLVLAKTAGFATLITLAAISRSVVHGDVALPGLRRLLRTPVSLGHPAPTLSKGPGAMADDPDAAPARRLTQAVAAEVGVAVAVLALTAWLVNAVPAKQAYAAPFATQVKAGPDFVNVVVDPAKAGPLTVHLYVLDAQGLPLKVPEVKATMANPGAGISGLAVPLQVAGPGHFVVYAFLVPLRGTWTLSVLVRVDDITEYRADRITVHIR